MVVKNKRRAALIAPTALLGGALMLPVGATAASAASAPSAAATPESPLKRIGVNREIAEAHGYEVRTGSNGVQYPVKKGSTTPADTRTGNCGKSWVRFTAVDRSRHYSSIVTGWQLNDGEAGAIDFSWTVHVIDNYGVSDKHWGHPLASEHFWHDVNRFTSRGPGPARAQVTSGTVIEWDGSICFSLGPVDHTRL